MSMSHKGGNFIHPMMHRFVLYYQASECTWSYQFKVTCLARVLGVRKGRGREMARETPCEGGKWKWSACHERGTKKKCESPTGFELTTSQTPGCLIFILSIAASLLLRYRCYQRRYLEVPLIKVIMRSIEYSQQTFKQGHLELPASRSGSESIERKNKLNKKTSEIRLTISFIYFFQDIFTTDMSCREFYLTG